jgi:TatD DNase family protein
VELVDTHAHLDDQQLMSDLDQRLADARAAGVVAVITIGTTAGSSETAVAIAERHAMVFAAVGIQPNHCGEAQPGDWQRIVRLVDRPRVVAIGETGLDRYWDDVPFESQQDYFDRHLQLSQSTGRPFVVHMRDCQDEVLEMLRAAGRRGPLRGVMHSYTGDVEGMYECVGLGLHISFAGMVTYKKSDALREVVRQVPDDRLLVETDSPYLSPHPHRGERPNHPAMVVHTAECLAEVRGLTLEELARLTRQNARDLFGI